MMKPREKKRLKEEMAILAKRMRRSWEDFMDACKRKVPGRS